MVAKWKQRLGQEAQTPILLPLLVNWRHLLSWGTMELIPRDLRTCALEPGLLAKDWTPARS